MCGDGELQCMKLLGIVGMPGSGKSELFKSPEYANFEKIDDVLANRELNEPCVRELIHNNKSVLVSDIEFCNAHVREAFEKSIGSQFEWICFENNPWKCAVNCIYRLLSGHNRNIMEELVKIDRLTQTYKPFGEIRSIEQMSLKRFWR